MHGIVFAELEEFANGQFGSGTWRQIVDSADTEDQTYLPTKAYSDQDAINIVQAASEMADIPVPDLLHTFGKHIAPSLLSMYGAQVDDSWGYLDLLENTEEQIHKVVRRDKPDASPPALRTERVADNTVEIRYASSRQMCPLLKGIAQGMADEYNEQIQISEQQCMFDGESECRVTVQKT